MPLEPLGVMDLVEGEHSITDEVATLPTPGHTPGHQTVMIASQGQRGLVTGDLIQSVVQVMRPDWGSRADVDFDKAREMRLAMVERIEREEMLVAAGHFPDGGAFWAHCYVGRTSVTGR